MKERTRLILLTCEPHRHFRLVAEMKLPGRAWPEFDVEEGPAGRTTVRQTAILDPTGLLGLGYWYLLYPLHVLNFSGMLRGIIEASRQSRGVVA